MFHTPPRRLHPVPPSAMTPVAAPAEATAMRQLRHQTKNALQRIIAQLARTELRATAGGATLADDLERRIRLSARVSDALFGLTAAPGPLDRRLATLCDATVALLSDAEQTIGTEVQVAGHCPAALHAVVVQVAHEMIGNAVKHGLHMRLVGHVTVSVRAGLAGTVLEVRDDGWGPVGAPAGEGTPIMGCLAEQHGGTVTLSRDGGWTVARMRLPRRP